jgi:hypothetical protein
MSAVETGIEWRDFCAAITAMHAAHSTAHEKARHEGRAEALMLLIDPFVMNSDLVEAVDKHLPPAPWH